MINITIVKFLKYILDQVLEIITILKNKLLKYIIKKQTQSLIQNREDNMARLERESNNTLNYINNVYINSDEINPSNTRSYIPTPRNYFTKIQ